jgi:PAS domain S-box-containing protein
VTPLRDKFTLSAALPREGLLGVLRIVLFYAVFAAAWILLSDSAVVWLFQGPEQFALASTLKGLLFVAITSLLLFFLLLRFAAERHDQEKVGADGTAPTEEAKADRRKLGAGIALFSVVFALLGGGGMQRDWQRHQQRAEEQLQSIARLKAEQIESWIDERLRDAEVIRSAPMLREGFAQWRRHGDPVVRQRLLARLGEFATMMHYPTVAICDANGEILLQAGEPHHGTSDALRAAARRALTEGHTVTTDLYRMAVPLPAHPHLDFVTPLPHGPGEAAPPAVLVLRVNVQKTLYDLLQSWPVPSATAETLLFRKEGNGVLFLNDLRHRADTALKLRLPLTENRVLAVQAMLPTYRPGMPLDGIDYRGAPVLGVGLPVGNTDWWLIAKVDRDEVFHLAREGAIWIAAASVLTWLAAVSFAVLFLQRRELIYTRRQRHEQTERLRVQQEFIEERQQMAAQTQEAKDMLRALIDALPDLVWLKNTEGRYLACNRRFEQFFGAKEADIIGKTDHDFVPTELADFFRARDLAAIAADEPTENVEEVSFASDGHRELLQTVKTPFTGSAGRLVGVLGIARDITKLKLAETDLKARNEELERFNRAMVGRELDMIELKRYINDLSRQLGMPPPHDLAILAPESSPLDTEPT